MSRGKANATPRRRTGNQITAAQLRVIDEGGTNLGVMARDDALDAARRARLELVEVSPAATPPVCRICDPGKLEYEEATAARRKRQEGNGPKRVRSHEIKLRPQVGPGDYQTKLRHIREFLGEGDQVRIVVVLRGRQKQRPGDADSVISQIVADVGDIADATTPTRGGGDVRLTLTRRPDSGREQR